MFPKAPRGSATKSSPVGFQMPEGSTKFGVRSETR